MDQAKQKIAKLVEKYDQLKKEGGIGKYNEAQTLSGFIEPLFMALGWDVHNLEEVMPEEGVSGGRVDRAFRINGITKFFLEAKSMKADLEIESYAKQAIKYSWNKGVDYAALTDFEAIKVFNANAQSKSLRDKIIFQISCENYVSDFEKLQLLSKEGFQSGSLDKYAEEHFKKSQKLTVNDKLYDDLKKARVILTNSFRNWNHDLDQETLDEGIQRILDRLVFIRVLEDRKLEDLILRPLTRDDKNNQELFHSLIGKFRELDVIYNSNLFQEHACEKWENYDHTDFKKVIELLYGNDVYEYDFKEIPADILGGVYESYLGYIAQNPVLVKGGKKGQLFELDDNSQIKMKSRKKRKEHGIYYTPKFIVDYIIKNSLGEKLKEITSINDLKKLKVLDPACGSGSFLTRALEEINSKYKEFGNNGDQYTKTEILLSNVYGVDLDSQAVELAKLNLLLDALDEKAKLPSIENVRIGNSLISGSEKELKKHFGKEWRDKNPFNWGEEFADVFKQGGFDVIIGNPPYGAELPDEDRKYLDNIYSIGSTDTAILFIKNSLNLLKDNGRLGLIIPKAFCFASNYKKIRDLIWDNVETIIDCGKVWKQVNLEQVIIILQKGEKIESYKSGVLENGQIKITAEIDKEISKKFSFFLNGVGSEEIGIAEKILGNSVSLNKISENKRGAMLQKYISESGELEVIGGMQIKREGIFGIKGRIYKEKISDNNAYIKPNSILVQNIIAHIENPSDHIKITASIPGREHWVIIDTVNQLAIDKNYSPYYIWAILNSNLINWYAYRFIFGKAIRTMHFDNSVTKRVPIIEVSRGEQKIIVDLSKNLLDLHKNLKVISKNSDKWNSIKAEIEKTDKEIDREVYDLYGLTEEEMGVVEGK
jgi:type I restriction-modification system DNA methylase subunit